MAISAPPEPATGAATRSLAGLTDAELVAEVRRGCDRAFEHLYERYHRRIAAYIYGMVGDYGRAEDVAQDVFMSALRRMRTTDRPIAFKPWIYEIAKNACIDSFRRTRRTEEVSIDADEGLGAADYGRLVTTGPAPDAAMEQKMALDHLCGAFGGLSQTHHEILVMREFEGLSYRQIGEKLGMSRPSVESTLFRARRRLGEEYQELVSGERCRRVQGIILEAAQAAAPGARDQRRLSAHLSHCQACRRHARMAGLDAALLTAPRGVRAKIAALIPLPGFLRRRWGGEDITPLVAHPRVGQIAPLAAHVGDPSLASWARAAGAAGALALAGIVGGGAAQDGGRSGSSRPAPEPVSTVAAPPPAAAPAPARATPARATAGAPALSSGPATTSPERRPAKSSTGAGAAPASPAKQSPAPPASPAPAAPATPAAPASAAGSLAGALPPVTPPASAPSAAPEVSVPAAQKVVKGATDAVSAAADALAGGATKTQAESAVDPVTDAAAQGAADAAAAAQAAGDAVTGSVLGG